MGKLKRIEATRWELDGRELHPGDEVELLEGNAWVHCVVEAYEKLGLIFKASNGVPYVVQLEGRLARYVMPPDAPKEMSVALEQLLTAATRAVEELRFVNEAFVEAGMPPSRVYRRLNTALSNVRDLCAANGGSFA